MSQDIVIAFPATFVVYCTRKLGCFFFLKELRVWTIISSNEYSNIL